MGRTLTKMEMKMRLLSIMENESKPTRIMYKMNTSWIPLMKYLNLLQKDGLIDSKIVKQVSKSHMRYYLTPKGKEVCQLIKKLSVLLEAET